MLGGRFQLFWPVTTEYYGTGASVTDQTGAALECAFFLASVAMMLLTRDIVTLTQPHGSNLMLAIPTFTVILPTFLSYPMQVPALLITPHVVYLAMFTTSILVAIPKTAKIIRTKLDPAQSRKDDV
jgi:hypothetical protein